MLAIYTSSLLIISRECYMILYLLIVCYYVLFVNFLRRNYGRVEYWLYNRS
jgi:hypothetical protein